MKDNINKLCKLIIKEADFNLNDSVLDKVSNLKYKLLNHIDTHCHENKIISPVVNMDVNIIICHFENISDLINYKDELHSYLTNNVKILLTNSKFNYIIESEHILRINVFYNKTNEEIIKNIIKGFHKHEIVNEFISDTNAYFDNPRKIKPFHINIKNIEQAKIFLKKIEK